MNKSPVKKQMKLFSIKLRTNIQLIKSELYFWIGLFNEDEMPNNSDTVFIISHYLTSLEKLRCDNIKQEEYAPYINSFEHLQDINEFARINT